MKQCVVTGAIAAAFCLCVGRAGAAGAMDPAALMQKAEAAKKAGDRIGALKACNEAAQLLRASGAPQAKIDGCMAEKDSLTVELLQQLSEIQKQQAEVVQLQRGIAQKIAKIAQADTDVQARVKKNENKIKDIETILLDAVK